MYNLTWTQAQEAMREGKRVKNRHFTGEEWFAFDGFHIVDEEGYYMDKWYKGYDWQDEGWMILDWVPQEIERQVKVTGPGMLLGEDYSALEERVIAFITGEGYDVHTTDHYVGITPRSPTLPREKENYNFRITKGRGHNKFQKRKKK